MKVASGGRASSELLPDAADQDVLFPKPVQKRKPAVMYDRAIKQLKTILHSKGLKDSASVL